jgi:hypothetical protein
MIYGALKQLGREPLQRFHDRLSAGVEAFVEIRPQVGCRAVRPSSGESRRMPCLATYSADCGLVDPARTTGIWGRWTEGGVTVAAWQR